MTSRRNPPSDAPPAGPASRAQRLRWRALLAGGAALGLAAAFLLWLRAADPGDPRLRAFVHARPPVPVVFTSRTEPASLLAAAPAGEGFVYPGLPLWQAREGRLRLMTPQGTVHELTWGRPLPDGSTLIDVMSPSVSDDGTRVLFAGRKGGEGPGHFRLYEVGLDGTGLRALTGGPDDEGCTAAPPMRWRHAGDREPIPDAERRAVDYDDVDPFPLNDGGVVFASSRTPDLGRDHARRSTNLWLLAADGSRRPLTANRNNDRWPFLMASNYIAFSLWSRNREVVTADGRDIRPFEPGLAAATNPTDQWLGAFLGPVGGHFGGLVKAPVPVWRPRALFNGRVAFMTSPGPATWADGAVPPVLQVAQAEPGLVANCPSGPGDCPLPRPEGSLLTPGPARDAAGRPLSLATPSPCPEHHVLLTGAALEPGETAPPPGRYGLYLVGDDWSGVASPEPMLLFDDPDFVDAEPVAVYARAVRGSGSPGPGGPAASALTLADGRHYEGPVASAMGSSLYTRLMTDLPGQRTDAGEGPVFDPPPEHSLDRIRVYASHRDRFDDPALPRVPGGWEALVEAPVKDGNFGFTVPAGSPTVLAGIGADGRVVRWETAAKDSQGRRGAFFAFAGDHYSVARAGGRAFCIGCHPGHSGMTRADHASDSERLR